MGRVLTLLLDYRKSLLLLLTAAILLCWGNTLWIGAKAMLAQHLIASAWQTSVSEGHPVRPWPWADTWPVAAIEFPNQRQTLFALAGSSGTSLAFGPGHLDGTALPSEEGTKVFSAHRDTHFRFLGEVKIGEIFHLQSQNGLWQSYRVKDTAVVDSGKTQWLIDPTQNEVHLITCYPLDSMALNPSQRYVVIAARV